MAPGKDPLRLGIHVTVYVALYFGTAFLFSGLLVWLGGYLTGVTGTGLLAACLPTGWPFESMENRHFVEIGPWLNRGRPKLRR